MAMLEPDVPPERKKKTIWLLAAGMASLLIPLAGALYLHWSQNAGSSGPTGRSDVFERREGDDRKVVPTQSAVVIAPSALTPVPASLVSGVAQKPQGSSLDFIKTNADMEARIAGPKPAPAAAPAASTAPAAPAVAAVPAPAAKPKAKRGRKEFSMPKLQPTRGFTNFTSPGRSSPGAQAGSSGGQDSQSVLNSLPAGAENDPRVQAYLKAHQGQ